MELAEMMPVLSEHARLEHAFDYSATMRTMTQDCYQEHTSIGLRREGQRACFEYYEGLFGAFPDFGAEQHGLAHATNYVVIWGTVHGTMTKDWLGLTATGKSFELPLVVIVEFRDGLLVGEIIRYDAMEFCQQLDLDYPSLIAAARRVTESIP
jgi:predicted ester cyclase